MCECWLFSETSISVFFKHVQHSGIIRGDMLRFSVPEGTEKMLCYGLLGGISTQAETMLLLLLSLCCCCFHYIYFSWRGLALVDGYPNFRIIFFS